MICRIFLADNRLAVTTPFLLKDVCKSIAGARWNKQVGAWTYPATPSAAKAIHHAFPHPGAVWADDAAALLIEAERIAEAAAHTTAENLPDIPLSKTKAWEHQKRAFWFAVDLLGGLPNEV